MIKPPDQSWTLDELAAKANAALSGSSDSRDSRFSEQLTARNIRRLQTEGAIDPPRKAGREAYYNGTHLDQLLEARSLMSKGVAASAIPALREASNGAYLQAPAAPKAPSTAQALAFLDAPKALGLAAESFPRPARAFASSMEGSVGALAKTAAARAVFECEPLPGLRISASPPPGSGALDSASLGLILEAVQAAWTAALSAPRR